MAIVVYVEFENHQRKMRLAEDATVSKLLPVVIEVMGLSKSDEENREISYGLFYRENRLNVNETLSMAGINEGDTIVLRSMNQIETEDRVVVKLTRFLAQLENQIPTGRLQAEYQKEFSDKKSTLHVQEAMLYHCPKNGSRCPYTVTGDSRRALVLLPKGNSFDAFYAEDIHPVLIRTGFRPVRPSETSGFLDDLCEVCHLIHEASLIIVDTSGADPNIMMELGLVMGFGRKAILIQQSHCETPNDLRAFPVLRYAQETGIGQNLLHVIWQSMGARAFRKQKCPVCGNPFIVEDEIFICINDQEPHHQECWEQRDCCSKCRGISYIVIDGKGFGNW